MRLMDNTHSADCAYPGVDILPDGTIVTTTYGHWTQGESPYIVAAITRGPVASAALALETPQHVAERAVAKGLTARDLEALVAASRKAGGPDPGKKKQPPELDANTREAVEKLTRALQTKVEIQRRKNRGILRIHFDSEEELIRLYDRLIQGNE